MQAQTTTAPEPPRTRSERRAPKARASRRRLGIVLVAIVLVPLVASAVNMIVRGGSYHPWGDLALFELSVRDVGHHAVLVGAYSRFGWWHPGPLEFYLLAVPYRLVAEWSGGLALGALLINGAAIAGIAYVAHRRAGTRLVLWALLVTMLLIRTFGTNAARNPWNPYVTVVPCLLVILLGWSLVEGDRWSAPLFAATGTFLVQAHVEYAPLVGVLGIGGLVVLVVRELRGHGRAGLRTVAAPLGISLAIAVVLWIPPVVDQVTNQPGNLGVLIRFFREHHPGHSASVAYHVVARELSWRPSWLVHWGPIHAATGEVDTSRAPLPFALLAIAAALVATWRRAPSARNLLLVVLASWAVGFWSVTHVVGPLYPYLLRWLDALGAATWLAIGWAVWSVLPRRRQNAFAPALAIVLVTGLVAASVVATVAAARSPIPYAAQSRTLTKLQKPVLAAARGKNGVVVVRRDDSAYAAATVSGVMLMLERHGIPARVDARHDPALQVLYDPRRLYDGQPVRAVLTVTAGGKAPPGSGTPVATADGVSVLRSEG
ncbi:MAG TPA: hypothetical protein VIB48_05590 [Acidimicrobiia bacterium]|jgi:hypothetical protein